MSIKEYGMSYEDVVELTKKQKGDPGIELSTYDVKMLTEVLEWCKNIDNRNCDQSLITVPRMDWIEETLEWLKEL